MGNDSFSRFQQKDSRYKRTVVAWLILFSIGIGLVFYLVISNGRQQVVALRQTVIELKANDDAKLNDLQKHVDCLFNLALHPNPAFIADATTCQISPSSLGGATGATKSPVATVPPPVRSTQPVSQPAPSGIAPVPSSQPPASATQLQPAHASSPTPAPPPQQPVSPPSIPSPVPVNSIQQTLGVVQQLVMGLLKPLGLQ